MIEQLQATDFNAEQLQRQDDALRAVNLISRATGREIPIISNAEDISLAPGAYILDPELCQRGKMSDVNFSMEPRMLSGAADSAHAVIAGELQVDYANKSAKSKMIEVAAKCYSKRTAEERFERVKREVDISKVMAENGQLALNPVAVAIAPEGVAEGAAVLLTEFDRDLFTLDNHPWERGLTAENIDVAVTAASAVSRFNTFGYHHKDAKIKNVAGRLTGEIGMIDFETTVSIDVNDPMQAAEAAHGDLGLFLKSLDDEGFFDNVANEGVRDRLTRLTEGVQRICEEGYLSQWENASPDVQMAVFDAVNEVAERVVAEGSARTVKEHNAAYFSPNS